MYSTLLYDVLKKFRGDLISREVSFDKFRGDLISRKCLIKIFAGIKFRGFRAHFTREIKSPRNLIPAKINPFKVSNGSTATSVRIGKN